MDSKDQSVSNFVASGFREILGENHWDTIHEQISGKRESAANHSMSNPFVQLGDLLDELVSVFGECTGLGLAQRAGSASFKYFQADYSDQLKLHSTEMQTKTLHTRLQDGLKAIAGCLQDEFGADVSFENSQEEWRWKVNSCLECRQRESHNPVCYFTVGLIQEFLSWSAGSKFYPVEEISCAAKGDACCEFRIAKEPIE